MHILEQLFIFYNSLALISCTMSIVSQSIPLPHQHQPSKISRTSSATWSGVLVVPSCIPMDFIALLPMTSVKRFTQATSTPKRYPTAMFILHMVEKSVPPMTNVPSPTPSSVFLALSFVGQPKTNHPI